jgi:hypothetical protein
LRHLCIKCIILPRQAREKHRENSKKEWRFLSLDDYSKTQTVLLFFVFVIFVVIIMLNLLITIIGESYGNIKQKEQVRKRRFLAAPFYTQALNTQNDHFTQTGSGQT